MTGTPEQMTIRKLEKLQRAAYREDRQKLITDLAALDARLASLTTSLLELPHTERTELLRERMRLFTAARDSIWGPGSDAPTVPEFVDRIVPHESEAPVDDGVPGEIRELQHMLTYWMEAGVFRGGEVYYADRDGGGVRVRVNTGWERDWSAQEFLVYVQGIYDAAWVFRRGK